MKNNKTQFPILYFKIPVFILIFTFLIIIPSVAFAATLSKAPNNLGLIGYWSFGEGAGTRAGDSSGHGNTGTINGATWVDGKYGKALSFDGSMGCKVTGTGVNLANSPFTVAFWYKPSSYPGTMFALGSAASSDKSLYVRAVDSTTVLFSLFSDDLSVAVPSQTNNWNFVVVTLDGSKLQSIYQNGSFINSRTANSMFTGDTTFCFGRDGWGDSDPYSGQLDDIRVYNRVLSAAEVAKLYQSSAAKIGVSKGNLFSENFETGNLSSWTIAGGSPTVQSSKVAHGKYALKLTSTLDRMTKNLNAAIPNNSTFYYRIYVYRTPSLTTEMMLHLLGYENGDTMLLHGVYPVTGDSYGNLRGGLSYEYWGFPFNQWARIEVKIFFTDASNGYVNWKYFNGDDLVPFANGFLTGVTHADEALNVLLNKIILAEAYDDATVYIDDIAVSDTDWIGPVAPIKINSSQNNKLTNGLVGLWSFDGKDISSDQAMDRSPAGGNNGTIYGAVKTIGKIGQGLSFNGSSDYITIPYNANINTNHFTIGAWVYVTGGSGNYRALVASRGSEKGYTIYANSDNKWVLWTYNGIGADILDSNVAVALNTWTHVIGTYDGTNTTIYINGVQKNQGAITYVPNIFYSFQIGAGANEQAPPPQFYLPGQIDDVRIYNRALSAAEVKQLYLMGK